MDRGGWVAWALTATLIAGIIGANAVVFVDDMASGFEEQSKAFPPERPWYFKASGLMLAGGAVILSISAFFVAYGWGKVFAKRRTQPKQDKPLFDEDEEDDRDPLQMPPGFLSGPKIRTKRHGLVPLVGFNLMALVLIAGGSLVVYLGVVQFVKAITMDGVGFKQAILWGRLVRFAGLPLMALAGLSFGLAWGRWFPLGQLEVIREERARSEARATRATWDRQS